MFFTFFNPLFHGINNKTSEPFYQNRAQAAHQELAERRKRRKREELKRYRLAKNLSTEVELTKRQSDELLYLAFKPTKRELLTKR